MAFISLFGMIHDFIAMADPLLISSMEILVCLITTIFAIDFFEFKDIKEIEPALKQLLNSTILMTVGIAIVTWSCLPSMFTIFTFDYDECFAEKKLDFVSGFVYDKGKKFLVKLVEKSVEEMEVVRMNILEGNEMGGSLKNVVCFPDKIPRDVYATTKFVYDRGKNILVFD